MVTHYQKLRVIKVRKQIRRIGIIGLGRVGKPMASLTAVLIILPELRLTSPDLPL